jgi:P4 family phage/plasmid primase-like protien
VTFDRNPVVTFNNGTLEIDTGRFRTFSEADYCSIRMDYDYDANARCPEWERFIQDVTNEEPRRQEILQFIAGYVLFPTCKHQKVFVLVGKGGNGKSVYLEIIQKLFGDENVTHIEPTGLAQEFQRIRLKDSLLNIGSDINSDFSRGEIREWLLKIADGTTVQACYKGMNHVDFIPRCKLVYACNAMPTAEIINGLNRRLQFIDFPCRYVEYPDPNDPLQKPRDVDIIPKLLRELPGIFNWAYRGYKELLLFGGFSDAPEQEELMRQFEQTSNPVMVFCEDYTFAGTITRDEIYQWYQEWCTRTGHKQLSRERFLPKFRETMDKRIVGERRIRQKGQLVRVMDFDLEHQAGTEDD